MNLHQSLVAKKILHTLFANVALKEKYIFNRHRGFVGHLLSETI